MSKPRKQRRALSLEGYLAQRLTETVRACKFKAAWMPRGWACVHIRTFAREIAAGWREASNREPEE